MRFAFYTVCPSPHQYPLAEELASRIGAENFRYISLRETEGERARLGWGGALRAEWEILPGEQQTAVRDWLENADVLFTSIRDVALFERRTQNNLRTFYCSERWFKPISVKMRWVSLPGWMRMVVPRYGMMVRRFVRWANEDPLARVFPIGPWAAADFRKMGVCPKKLVPWGYFVADASTKVTAESSNAGVFKVLWVGRMLDWKRVDTIIRAVTRANETLGARGIALTLVGDGPEKLALQTLARKLDAPVEFRDSVSIAQVRELMRAHDLYVLASNGYEGWGAVVSEALEEGMLCVGTREAGSSATILPATHQFKAGDVKALARLILEADAGRLSRVPIGEWTAKAAAERLMKMVE